MTSKINILKKCNKLFVLSDGSSYIEPVIFLKNYNDYILLNQDINNNPFWIDKIIQSNTLEKLNIFPFRDKNNNK